MGIQISLPMMRKPRYGQIRRLFDRYNDKREVFHYRTIKIGTDPNFILENKIWFDKIRVEDEETNMWNDLDMEQIVIMVRLELYNRGLPCGPKALRKRLNEHEVLKTALPSERTIARILARNGLTYGRTGWYEGDESEDMLVNGAIVTPDKWCY